MSETTEDAIQPEHIGPHEHEPSAFERWLLKLWYRLPRNFRLNLNDIIRPENIYARLIEGEVKELEIQLAWYRDIVGHIVFHHFRSLLFGTTIIAIIVAALAFSLNFNLSYMLVPFAVLIGFSILGAYERFEYSQWRLLKTNARLIISLPQHGAWPLVDNIELKGLPTVLDTNWSTNPVWRVFQFFTGARDLYISMAALQFAEGTARVKDALIIPDIMPDDVHKLKQLVFKPN